MSVSGLLEANQSIKGNKMTVFEMCELRQHIVNRCSRSTGHKIVQLLEDLGENVDKGNIDTGLYWYYN